ncbi:hypothetical protein AB0O28_02435 [Microbispora sp. NPDC088329]|uniref:hypothetical protein n=1 Tax=Microbispora sp. NPDC088329 TaxID=3154869 RepID=UPI003438E4A9
MIAAAVLGVGAPLICLFICLGQRWRVGAALYAIAATVLTMVALVLVVILIGYRHRGEPTPEWSPAHHCIEHSGGGDECPGG